MSAHNDIVTLQRRANHLIQAATGIRDQLADLHAAAWERTNSGAEKVRESKTDHVPPVGDLAPYARKLWNDTQAVLERAEAAIVGIERRVTGHFMVTAALEPSRGSLITKEEHARQLANQQTRRRNGEYTPARLLDQPPHPGKNR